ncbi:MAG: ribonuclease Y [Eubacteriales bacterium]|nr:ribonuclease Y [Eubacteriales bacterium]MDY3332996.1 ribonuclease Y [Gallibacter sp.]
MDTNTILIILGIVAIIIGLVVAYNILRKSLDAKTLGSAEQRAKNLILDAENRAETLKKETIVEAKETALKLIDDAEKEIKERRNDISKLENRLIQKEESLDKKLDNIERKTQSLADKEESINKKRKELDDIHKQQLEQLEKISGYTKEEAKNILLESIKSDIKHDASIMIKEIEGKAREEADKRAKNIIANAIQRCAADHVAENTVSVVSLPNDEMKGRIIGREGRNIRALENATGIELIIDDTPEAVILSGFDSVRREIAKLALEKLVVDGRIHPARIEEMVAKAEKEIGQRIKEAGEEVTFDLGIHNLHPELIKLVGRLKYRTSYGQNALKHSQEVAYLAGLIAGELELDIAVAKRAGLLHDIGKALDHEKEGTHIQLGMEVLKKYKEQDAIIDAMKSHHGDYEPVTIEAVIVAAADALSAARPGARKETLESYIKRLEALEEIANTTEGVEKSYAIQAGREIRIIAKPDEVKDDELPFVAREIAKKIEQNVNYPGQIKVNICRETRAIEYAK